MGIQSLFFNTTGIRETGCNRYLPTSRLGKVALTMGILFSGIIPGLMAWGIYCAGVAIRNSLQGKVSRSQSAEVVPVAARVIEAVASVISPPSPTQPEPEEGARVVEAVASVIPLPSPTQSEPEDSELDKVAIELKEVLDELQRLDLESSQDLWDLVDSALEGQNIDVPDLLKALHFYLKTGKQVVQDLQKEREQISRSSEPSTASTVPVLEESSSPLPPSSPDAEFEELIEEETSTPSPRSEIEEPILFRQQQAGEKEQLKASLSLVLTRDLADVFVKNLLPPDAQISFQRRDENGCFLFTIASSREFIGSCAGVPATVHLPQGTMSIKIDPHNSKISFENAQFFFKVQKDKLPSWIVGIPEQFTLFELQAKDKLIIPKVMVSGRVAQFFLNKAIDLAANKKLIKDQDVRSVWSGISWQ